MTAFNRGFLGFPKPAIRPLVLVDQISAAGEVERFLRGIDASADEWLIIGENIIPASNNGILQCNFSIDNGATYDNAAASYQTLTVGAITDNTAGANGFSTGSAAFSIVAPGMSNAVAGGGVSFDMWLHRPGITGNNKHAQWNAVSANGTSSTFTATYGIAIGVSATLTNNRLNALRFSMSAGGAIASGTFYLYAASKIGK